MGSTGCYAVARTLAPHNGVTGTKEEQPHFFTQGGDLYVAYAFVSPPSDPGLTRNTPHTGARVTAGLLRKCNHAKKAVGVVVRTGSKE